MSDHDKKCEVILWKSNLWNACWCHERALEAENATLKEQLAEAERNITQWKKVYGLRGRALMRPCVSCGHVPLVINAVEIDAARAGQTPASEP